MAVDAFQPQIVSTGTEVEDLVLRLGMKTASGGVTWVPLRPERWTDIVRDGDEIWLQLGSDGAEVVGLRDPGPLITFRYSVNGCQYSTTIILPKTYEVSYIEDGERDPLNLFPTLYQGSDDHLSGA